MRSRAVSEEVCQCVSDVGDGWCELICVMCEMCVCVYGVYLDIAIITGGIDTCCGQSSKALGEFRLSSLKSQRTKRISIRN